MKTIFLWCHYAVGLMLMLMLLLTPQVFAEELVSVQVSRVDEKGDVNRFEVRGEWQWGSDVPCVRVLDQRISGLGVRPCLSEVTTIVPIKNRADNNSKVTARYIFDLPFDHLVVLLSPLCIEQGLRLETVHSSQGFGVVAVACTELKKIKIGSSNGLRVTDLHKNVGSDFTYEVKNQTGNFLGQFTLIFPRPKPTPTPVPTPLPLPSPTPKPMPKPIVKVPEVKRRWFLGAYLGFASVSHTNADPTGAAQSLSWKGGQIHAYFDAMKSDPLIYSLYPEIELHGNQLGSLSGFTLINASLSRNLSKSKSALLLLGLGGNLIGMNGSTHYGIITSMGYGLHLSWRSMDQRYFVTGSMGPLLTPVPSLTSAWFGITGDYRIRLFNRPVHLGIDFTWLKVPGSISGANVDYSSKSYGLMLGYYFGE